MNAKLMIIGGPDEGRTLEINTSEPLVLGRRSAERGQGINDPRISKQHCQLSWNGQVLEIQDLKSTNGTIVDGRRIEKANLSPGDSFQIGSSEFLIQRPKGDVERMMPNKKKPRGPYPELVFSKLGTFEVGEIIAVGSTSVVFKAKDTQANRDVALKVLRPEASQNDDDLKRFVRAVKTMMPVTHPNLVTIYGAGKTGDYCWMSMEYVEGENLTDVIKRLGVAGMLDPEYALRMAAQIARALQIAYENGIVHRNLTPRHILANKDGTQFKLADLVLAKATEGTLAVQVSGEHELVGEVSYMSPEQTQGTTDLDIRSDIYGLGATLYALLAGKPAFEGGTAWTIITRIRDEAPDPVWKNRLGLSEFVTDVVLKMMAKKPEDRFQTPEELLEGLERAAKLSGFEV